MTERPGKRSSPAAAVRATLTPNKGDQQRDWVLHPSTACVNDVGQTVWVTDSLALFRVDSTGTTGPLLAPLWTSNDGNYPWGGYDADWTTLPDNLTCGGWSSTDPNAQTDNGQIIVPDFGVFEAFERCQTRGYLLCVQQ